MPKIRTQLRILVNVGLRGGVPWLQGTSDIICPLCKVEPEGNFHFMLRCNIMKPEWDKFWEKLLSIVEVNCRQECNILTHFLRNLDNYSRILLLSGGLKLPFQINKTNDLILNLTPENVTQHSRIVTTTRKGSSTPTKMSKIVGRQIH